MLWFTVGCLSVQMRVWKAGGFVRVCGLAAEQRWCVDRRVTCWVDLQVVGLLDAIFIISFDFLNHLAYAGKLESATFATYATSGRAEPTVSRDDR